MLTLRIRRAATASLAILAAAACSETVTAPLNKDSNLSVVNNEFSVQADTAIAARALASASGVTRVEVTLGKFAYITPGGAVVPAVPGNGTITHVHIKFCKPLPAGAKQFSANFEFKSDDPLDKDPDNEPDSPLDPKDHAKTGVNWDRSASHSILTGGPSGAFNFTGIPRSALLEVRVGYDVPFTEKDGEIEKRHYEVKLCIPVLPPPDLQIIALNWPTGGTIGQAINFRSSVSALPGTAPIPSTTTCVAYVDGSLTPAGTSAPVTVDPTTAAFCTIPVTFTTTGLHTVVVRLVGTTPGDDNPANDSTAGTLTIGGGLDPSVLGFKSDPTIIETLDSTFTNDTQINNDGTKIVFPPQVTFTSNQSSSILLQFDRVFTGPVAVSVSQVTSSANGPVTLHSGSFTFTSGTQTFQSLIGNAFSLALVTNAGAGSASLTYSSKSGGSSEGPNTGTYNPYGDQTTFNFTIVNAGYTFTYSRTVPIRIQSPVVVSQTGCDVNATFQLCHNGYTVSRRKDGEGGAVNVTLPGTHN